LTEGDAGYCLQRPRVGLSDSRPFEVKLYMDEYGVYQDLADEKQR
jgi:hypothetical protein